MIKQSLFTLLILCTFGLTGCGTTNLLSDNFSSAQPSVVNLQGFPNEPVFWAGNTSTVWNKLQHVSLPELQKAANQSTDPNSAAWLKLAVISKQYSTNNTQLISQLIAWRAANPSHVANALFPDNATLTNLQNTPPPHHIVLLLPLQGNLATSGGAVRDGFVSAYYSSANKPQQTVSFLDTTQNQNISALYQQALAQGADSVIGPLTKEQVQELARSGSFPYPTLALNYTDGSLPTNFYEFGLSPLDEAKQAAEKAMSANHRRAIIIAPQDDWGQRVTKTLTANWNALGGSVVDTFYFNGQTDFNQSIPQLLHANTNVDRDQTDRAELEKQRRQDFDVIFLLANPQSARQIVPLLKYYYADKIPIYSTSAIYSGKPSAADSDLNGVTFSDAPWALQANAKNASRLYAVGRDAYLIANQLNRLRTLPNFPIYGATGALTLTPQQQIYRRIAWVQMHNGHP